MGWVVDGIIRRRWGRPGVYAADEWERFCFDNKLSVSFVDLPASFPGLIVGNIILVRRGLSCEETARLVWHEIGHWACHVGNRRFWQSRPFGRSTIRKMERQASEFAERFPLWGGDGF